MLSHTIPVMFPGLHRTLTGYASAPAQNADPSWLRKYAANQIIRATTANPNKLQVILSGFAKTSMLSETGEACILGFCMPGDVLGLGGMAARTIASEIVFLSDAVVAELPLEEARGLQMGGADLGGLMCDLISRELLRTQWRNRLVRYAGVNSRAADFLLEIGQRFAENNLPSHKFRLFMSREDMAVFLGMTKCTLSRALHWLSKRDLICIDGRWIEIVDPLALSRV